MRCPHCQSEFVYFSNKYHSYICEDCGKRFDDAERSALRIFFSYGHDKNRPIVELIKEELESRGHIVWIDKSRIRTGQNWREQIAKGIIDSDEVVAFLSRHSVRKPGVCLDELRIALCVRNADIKTVLLESQSDVEPPSSVASRQWLDMSDWQIHYAQGGDEWTAWFASKMDELASCLESSEAVSFRGEIAELRLILEPVTYGNRESHLLESTFVGREWLLDEVVAWKETLDTGTFVLTGVPGSGKSTFASYLAHYDADVAATIFFEYDRPELAVFDAVSRMLSFQLAAKLPDYRTQLLHLLRSRRMDLELLHDEALFDMLVRDPLHSSVVGGRGTTLIVIDALDELYELNQSLVPRLLHKISQLPTWIRLFVTMRPETDLAFLLEHSRTYTLDAANTNNANDVALYLMSAVADKAEALALSEKCEGSFLYATMLSQAFESGELTFSQALELEGGLSSCYHINFLRRFGNKDRYAEILPALELIVGIPGILREVLCEVLELDAYAYQSIRRALGPFLTITRQPMVVHQYFSSVSTMENQYSEDQVHVMRLVHKSLFDWLRDGDQAGPFVVDEKAGQRRFATYALNYVEASGLPHGTDAFKTFLRNNLSTALISCGMVSKYIEFLCKHDVIDAAYWRGITQLPDGTDTRPLVEWLEQSIIRVLNESIRRGCYSKYPELWAYLEVLEVCLPRREFVCVFKRLFDTGGELHFLPAFFCSPASDSYRHRGLEGFFNLDKIAIAHAVERCYKRIQAAGISCPRSLHRCVYLMRLSSLFYEGTFDGSSGGITYTASHRFAGDVCELDEQDIRELAGCREYDGFHTEMIAEYNTACLTQYFRSGFTESPEADDYVGKAVHFGANLEQACIEAWGRTGLPVDEREAAAVMRLRELLG